MSIHRLVFSINIGSNCPKIWKAIWDENCYREWANVFSEGSYYHILDSWEEGRKIHFLSADQSGIYSIIESYIPNKVVKFKHVGIVSKGKELLIDNEVKKWSGTTEIYSLTENTETAILKIEIDVLEEHVDFMSDKLPKALDKIKNLSMQ